MKKFSFTFVGFFLICFTALSQQTKLYINLASHNEIQGEFYDTDSSAYVRTRDSLMIVLNKINSIGGKWNFQTCSKFVLGALRWEDAATSGSDMLDLLEQSGNVQIDPRNKKQFPDYNYNISDVYHLLDSSGVQSTHTVGGFIHYPFANEDWTQFRNVTMGSVYHLPWQADVIWGGGSPNHSNDANDYGIWKPKDGVDETNFYTHAPDSNLWLVGNGCAPLISDTTTSVQWIVNLINKNVDDLENGYWPANKFYSLTVMINCRDLDLPNHLKKIDTVLNAIDACVQNSSVLEWATITEKLSLFQAWSQTNSIAYSQWSCADASDPSLGILEATEYDFQLFPNPATYEIAFQTEDLKKDVIIYSPMGKIVEYFTPQTTETIIELSNFPAGIYLVRSGDRIGKFEVIK